MRVMVGLTPATRARPPIGGHRYRDIPNPGRMSASSSTPPPSTPAAPAARSSTLGAKTMGLPESRVDEMLELVSPRETEAKRRVRNYSLGMRQRLGIAHALLGDPAVLILDEPANGLDPAGIRWMRDLLKDYADRGGTVLLSSHLLNEVEPIADDMILIGRGRIVAQGDKKTLLAEGAPRSRDRRRQRRAPRPSPPALAPGAGREGLAVEAEPLRRRPRRRAAGIVLTDLRPPTAASRTSSSSSPPTPSATTFTTRRSHGMSAVVAETPTLDISETTRVPFGRLVRLEAAQARRHPRGASGCCSSRVC